MRRLSILVVSSVLTFAAACSKDAHEYIAQGDRYVAEQKFDAAIIEYRNAVAADGKSGEARLKLGTMYQAIGDVRKAHHELVRAADLLPDNVDAQLRAANIRLAVGQFAEAKEHVLAVLAKDPKNVFALVAMGNALAGLKDLDGAITHFEHALEAEPRLTLAYGNLGGFQIAKGDREAAEATFKRAIAAAPTSITARLNLGNFYWANERPVEAERELKAAVEIDAKSTSAVRALATFYIVHGRRSEAEPLLKTYATSGVAPKLVLADFYLEDRRTKEAVEVLTPLTEDERGFAAASIRLAAIDFNDGRRPEAYSRLDAVLGREPASERALEMKTRFLLLDNKFDEALAIADTVIRNNPNAVPSMYLRATALELKGAQTDALDAFRAVLQKAPESLATQLKVANLYLAIGNPQAAAEILGGTVKSHPQSGYAHFLRGQALLRMGDVTGAEAELQRVAAAIPTSADAQTWLGLLHQVKADVARARAALDKATKLDPKSPVVLAGLIGADIAEKKHDVAKRRVEAALAEYPTDVPRLLLAGNTYLAVGDLATAEATFEKVLQHDANNLEAYGKLAVLYHSQRRLDEAKRKYEQLVQRHQQPVVALTFLGMVYALEKNLGEARAHYQRALDLNPNAGIAANNLAWIYAEAGEDLDKALNLAQTAKAQMPAVAEVNDTLGWVYYKKGFTREAVTFLEEASRQGSPNPGIFYRLGLAYAKAGDAAKAQAALTQALKLNPQFEHAGDARRTLAELSANQKAQGR
jgi:tetratricopeptide (TPR) repeat protein